MNKKLSLALAISFILVGGIALKFMMEVKPMTPTEVAVTGIAREYVAVHFPDFDLTKHPQVIHDKGGFWEVEYELPRGVIGGTPVVVIEKTSLTVLRSFHTQ